MTHDSIGLGEDGPTHQPVEHMASLRAMPNLLTMRPCDAIETAECWEVALQQKDRPSVLALSRQGVPTLCEGETENLIRQGRLYPDEGRAPLQAVLIATGTESIDWLERPRRRWKPKASARASYPCRARNCSMSNRLNIAKTCCPRAC